MVPSITTDTAPFPQPATLRVVFRKVGRMQYISHLDLVRTMTRVILRARLPVAYSEGFNPIPRLSFAAPLSVGVESDCEIMDIKITHPVDTEVALQLLRENLTDELFPECVYMAETKPHDIAFVSYRIEWHRAAADTSADALRSFFGKRPIEVLKNTKAGEKTVDISPLLDRVTVTSEKDVLAAEMLLRVENASFINPDYFVRAAEVAVPALTGSPTEGYTSVRRLAFYTEDRAEFR